MRRNNELLGRNCKLIKVTGVPGLDTLTSVYGTDGLKVAGAFDNKKQYTCEFEIDFKLLGFDISKTGTFTYHIIEKGKKPQPELKPLYITPGAEAFMNGFTALANEGQVKLATPTDFWGTYILALK